VPVTLVQAENMDRRQIKTDITNTKHNPEKQNTKHSENKTSLV